jgi:hypothetical protein
VLATGSVAAAASLPDGASLLAVSDSSVTAGQLLGPAVSEAGSLGGDDAEAVAAPAANSAAAPRATHLPRCAWARTLVVIFMYRSF